MHSTVLAMFFPQENKTLLIRPCLDAKKLKFDTVAFSFVFDEHCPTMD